MESYRVPHGVVKALEVGDFFSAHVRELISPGKDQDLASMPPLLCPQRFNDVGAGLLGPIRAGLRHAASLKRIHFDVWTHHEQAVIALRRREFNVRVLARLNAT